MEWQDWLEKDGKKDFAIRERNYEKLSTGGGKPDKSLLLNTDKPDKTIPQIKRDFVDDADDKEYKNASWEDWLEKNNAIETSHKDGEKKEEWDGKFSSSTIRDDAKNDDEKAESEEESLEELTDGKLEEVEKLKSWEVFLKGDGGTGEDLPHEEGEITGKKDMHSLTGRYQNPIKHKKGHFANTNTGKDAVQGTKKIPTSRVGTFQDTKNTKNLTADDIEASAKRIGMITNNDLGAGTDKHVKTQDELDKEFYERTQPEPKGTKSHKRVISRRARKSWEVWLEKGVTHEDPTKGVKGGMTKVPVTQAETPEEIMEAAKNPKTTIELDAGMKKSWELFLEKNEDIDKIITDLARKIKDPEQREDIVQRQAGQKVKETVEKMQGAGDARFGNQHLTGLDQKPVNNEEDEANILPEKDEKRNEKDEKQDKTEEKDSNKPYKALGED